MGKAEKEAEETEIAPETAMSHEGMQRVKQIKPVLLMIATIVIFLKCAVTSAREPCVRCW